ncbi:hypothetical protein K525DRAFT_189781 [Schizophyllum commune Loenen D]|nr:hypothetical protein K525DRAFT_189781 [Schizophyllum commune Loenen D]
MPPKRTEKGSSSPTKSKSRRTKKSGADGTTASSIAELRRARDKGVEQYGKAKNTQTNYKGYIRRCKGFLAQVVANRRQLQVKDDMDTDVLELALDKPPNKHSAEALEMFITQKCLAEDCTRSTSEGAQAAWKRYWDEMDGTKYRGEYKYDEATERVTGNPAQAPGVRAIVDIVKKRHKKKGEAANREHADAMTIQDLGKIIATSERQYPAGIVDHLDKISDGKEMYNVMLHIMMRAFLTSGFTLWTRNFELCSLQRRDITFNLDSGSPNFHPYFRVFLDCRKGWQNQQAGNDLPAALNTYNIYAQPELHELDMYTHLLLWIRVLEFRLGRPLKDDDHIFPYFSTNGIVQPEQAMSHDVVQDHINKFAQGARVETRYTTHSLRRGGAQYRFMFASIGKRWSLKNCRWWGGWAVGENVETLMKYLLDSLQHIESSYSDALNPDKLAMDESFLAERDLMKLPTVGDFRALSRNFHEKLEAVASSISTHPLVLASPYAPIPTGRSLHPAYYPSTSLAPSQTPYISAPPHISPTCSSGSPTPSPTSYEFPHPLTPPVERSAAVASPGIRISNIARGPDAWRKYITQWEEPDPDTKLPPLKDWQPEWYKTATLGSKRNQRRIIAQEYTR